MDSSVTFFNSWEDIETSRNHLPHWQQPGATYFITFRMADAVPTSHQKTLAEEKEKWLKHHPKPWDKTATMEYHRRFMGALERWIDEGHGSCFLRDDTPRGIVASALRHFDGERYILHSAVVMPNHAHVVASLEKDQRLENVLHSWKSFTAHEITRRFSAAPKPFWQEDYFDRLVRDGQHFNNCVRYIQKNPMKAGLSNREYDLYESKLANAVL